MPPIKILYIATEINPFTKNTEITRLVKSLATATVKQKMQARIVVPRFGIINQRINSIHEVLRLSGVNINLGVEQYSLLVKVASIRDAKLQVYFIDNEELFERKGKMSDKNGKFYADNDSRSIFFCKATLSTIKRQEWSPDIIHCHGWFSAFVPLYLKTTYRNSAIFKHTKCIYTLHQDGFATQLDATDIVRKIKLRDVQAEDLGDFAKNPSFQNLMRLAAQYADATTHSFKEDSDYSPELLKELGSKYIDEKVSVIESYLPLYKSLVQKK